MNASQEMDMDMDLEDMDYTPEIVNLQGHSMDNNMVAVKIGDVTENASVNLTSVTTEVRSSKSLDLEIQDRSVESGEQVAVEVTSANFSNIYGYQFTLEAEGLAFEGVERGAIAMTDGNIGVLSRELLTMSYNTTRAVKASEGEVLFTLTFTAERSGMISEMLEITSKVTNSEAYRAESASTQEIEIMDVTLTTRGAIAAATTSALYQNEPNPFKGQTVIGFDLAEAGQATIRVFDVTGKLIVNRDIDGVRGYNTTSFTADQLGQSGVLYYTLESGDFTATKKMIVIE